MKIIKITLLCCLIFAISIQCLYAAFCSQCGKEAVENAKFCPSCGAKLSASSKENSQIENNFAITGNAYITLGGGTSNILRGLKIYLIPDSKEFQASLEKIRTIGNTIQAQTTLTTENFLSQGSRRSVTDMSKFYGMFAATLGFSLRHIDKCYSFFSDSATLVTKTNVEGKFAINKLPAGKYYLYAKYETTLDEGYWLIPVEIQAASSVEVTLDNDSLNNEGQYLHFESIETFKKQLEELIFISTSYDNLTLANLRLGWAKAVLKYRNSAEPQYPTAIKH